MRQQHIINIVLNFVFVLKYQVGDKVEIPVAEELLAAYNDFHASNLEYYQGKMKSKKTEDDSISDAETEAEESSIIEKNANDDVKAFDEIWGSMDFANATLVGLSIDWDKIQEKIIAEQERNIRPAESEMANVGRQLRKVSSVLAFSERVISRLRGKAVDKEMIDLMIKGFEMLLNQVYTKDIKIPELEGAENTKFSKIKTVDGIIDYANKLFELGR